ncbi:MAG: SET domain-containing protein-lysine N-methyltransferase [Gemmatimonadota bacterium]|nr:SET domain-containing protein-lysine N-methyltransferase [Gemmatimonadota bacterium]
MRRSPIQGRGVFATRRIPKGTRLIEYTGRRITPDQADDRYDDDLMEHAHTFLFTVDDETVVDARFGGNAARWINHSCAPNCEAVIEDGRIFIETLRDIPRGAELLYDYQLQRSGRFQRAWLERYACRCGARRCRGIILERKPPRAICGKAPSTNGHRGARASR